MKFRTLLLFTSSLLLILQSCSSNESTLSGEFELVWSEEFSGDSIDTNTWVFWEGPAYNNELQYYTPRPDNAFIGDGKLHLKALRESYRGYDYTSARISSDSTRIGWKHGRFEASIKMPAGQGFWPAFWLMPMRDDGWPRGGEIDIMEFRGNELTSTSGAVHYWMEGCEGNPVQCRNYITEALETDIDLSSSFNLYALEWDELGLTWYFNDIEFMYVPFTEIDAEFEPFSTPFYIILNLAVGGDFLPNPDENTEFPQSLVVDYVRVYQK